MCLRLCPQERAEDWRKVEVDLPTQLEDVDSVLARFREVHESVKAIPRCQDKKRAVTNDRTPTAPPYLQKSYSGSWSRFARLMAPARLQTGPNPIHFRGKKMIELESERFRLSIPVGEALAFAMGWSNLGYSEPSDGMRRVVGVLAVGALEHEEHWREAALARHCLGQKWPGGFTP